MLPSSSDLTYFLEVANTLNLSRAAERLGISQPSLSNAMVRLEETLGIAILIRHKRGVDLTQAGKQLLKHARHLLQQWEDLKSETLASHQKVQGYYTLGCHTSIAEYALPHFMPHIVKKYPHLELHLKHDLSRKITEEVISLKIDIGIVINPVKHPDLVIYKLFNDETTLWQNIDKMKSLDNPPLICDPNLAQTEILLKQLKKKNILFDRLLTSNSLDVIATLTANGCGVGMLPWRLAMARYSSKLSHFRNAPSYHDEVCIIYRPENREVAAIKAIISEIKKIVDLSPRK